MNQTTRNIAIARGGTEDILTDRGAQNKIKESFDQQNSVYIMLLLLHKDSIKIVLYMQ